jgi:small subunit ribosomal protein S5
VAGGRRFSFRAAIVVGDRNGRVGMGLGKGPSVAEAVDKGAFQAKKRMVSVPLTAAKSIPHTVEAKFSASRIVLKPGREGRGIVAGGPVRVLADLAGIRNLTAKILGRTPNKLNNARATLAALEKLKTPDSRKIAASADGKNNEERAA